MSTTQTYQHSKTLPVVLGKRTALFLFIGVLGFLLIKIVGPILQSGPEYVVEAIVSGIPLLIAAGSAIAALTLAVVHRVRRKAA
ncbi:hypothetical protein [Brevibacterium linens]|uniref:Uncharacterized protein n=2 Tax=Brevibacterium linens TaxID=1703 RepID=A0A2H1K712_BRELN|nr:hypothetical protein [Brevibacterium linens]KAB1948262.1 hypothetical protein F8227_06460 [Brevibacterium linens ATCC 9172]SMX76159.1 hypothetical protein BLIN9172_01221 [Brevibacterium linens ATCC 9172]SMX95530.1 hypothetical protein BLIN101_03070 [Brevibacterium linens]